MTLRGAGLFRARRCSQCGYYEYLIFSDAPSRVVCHNCGHRGPKTRNEALAVIAWNYVNKAPAKAPS